MDFNEEGFYEFQCACGHLQRTFYPIPKYELLVQIAALALYDGHFRETIDSSSAALERYYEFFLRFVHFKHRRPSAEFEATWKAIENQSERQLGAFLFAYLSEFGKVCPRLPDHHVTFRNKVTHKGRLPSHKEAAEFAQRSINFIKDRIQEIAAVAGGEKELHDFSVSLIDGEKKKHPEAHSVVTWTVLSESLAKPFGQEFDIGTYLEIQKRFRHQW
jgi:hypothetical protein